MPSHKILVVDDEPDIRAYLAQIIAKRIGCEVDQAGSGEEALLKLKDGAFTIVLLDIKMPGLSGIDVIKEGRVMSPTTKFLAISGYDSHEVADEAIKAGAVDFMAKPQTAQAVEAKVREIMGK